MWHMTGRQQTDNTPTTPASCRSWGGQKSQLTSYLNRWVKWIRLLNILLIWAVSWLIKWLIGGKVNGICLFCLSGQWTSLTQCRNTLLQCLLLFLQLLVCQYNICNKVIRDLTCAMVSQAALSLDSRCSAWQRVGEMQMLQVAFFCPTKMKVACSSPIRF